MVSKVFVVYDCKVGAYLNPFNLQSKGAAIRSFGDAANDPETAFYRHPEDYTLFEIGEYDDEQGSYTMHDAKISLGTALEFKKQMELPQQLKLPQSDSVKAVQ